MFRRLYDAEPREWVRKSDRFQNYVALMSAFLQLRQRLDFMADENRLEEEKLMRAGKFEEAVNVQTQRITDLERTQAELAALAAEIQQNPYYQDITKNNL